MTTDHGGIKIAYQNILQTRLTSEEVQTLLNKQIELSQLEKYLLNLQEKTQVQTPQSPKQ